MKKIIKLLILVLIIASIFYLLYLEPGSIIIKWYNYEIIATVLSTILLIVVLGVIYSVIKYFYNKINLLFTRINLNETLSDYLRNLEVKRYFDKEIQLQLISYINNLKTLKFFVYLNDLLNKKQYIKLNKIIRLKINNVKLKNLLSYINIEVMLKNNKIKEAAEFCKMNLSTSPYKGWIFLKLLDISLTYNLGIEYFRLLNNIIGGVKLNSENLKKSYCLINYKIAVNDYNKDDNSKYKNLISYIKKYPKFLPFYVLIIKHLISINKYSEANEYLIKSWYNVVIFENTILFSKFIKTQGYSNYSKEISRLIKNSNNNDTDQFLILATIISVIFGNLLEAKDFLMRVNNKANDLYKLAYLYFYLSENNLKDVNKLVYPFVGDVSISNNWWNEYIKLPDLMP